MIVLSASAPRTKPPRYRTETKVQERAGRWWADIKREQQGSGRVREREEAAGQKSGALVMYSNGDNVHIVHNDEGQWKGGGKGSGEGVVEVWGRKMFLRARRPPSLVGVVALRLFGARQRGQLLLHHLEGVGGTLG